MKSGEFFDQVDVCQFLKEYSASCCGMTAIPCMLWQFCSLIYSLSMSGVVWWKSYRLSTWVLF